MCIPWYNLGTSCTTTRVTPSSVMVFPSTDDDGYSSMASSALVQVSSSSCISRIVHGTLDVKRSRILCKGASILSFYVSALAASGGEGFFSSGFLL